MTHEREQGAPEAITCHHCNHEWEPRKKNPKKCPQCQNPLWKSTKPKRRMQPKVEVVPTPTAVSEAPAPTPPTTDTPTTESPSAAAGADDLQESEVLQPIYTRVEVDEEPETAVQRLQREAEERLRRLANGEV